MQWIMYLDMCDIKVVRNAVLEHGTVCPINCLTSDCLTSEWSGWAKCTAECERALESHARNILMTPMHGGEPSELGLSWCLSCDPGRHELRHALPTWPFHGVNTPGHYRPVAKFRSPDFPAPQGGPASRSFTGNRATCAGCPNTAVDRGPLVAAHGGPALRVIGFPAPGYQWVGAGRGHLVLIDGFVAG